MNKDIKISVDSKRIRPATGEVDRLYSSNSKAKRLLNWKPNYTGFNGFKGSWMSLILYNLGAEVHGYSLNEKKNKVNENVFKLKKICKSYVYGDICDYKKLSFFFKKINPDYCIHMAAQSLVLDSFKYPEITFNVAASGCIPINCCSIAPGRIGA
jgi:CDP-glucose 4,6-dehydratase